MIHILVISLLIICLEGISVDNVCTFHIGGKLFSLIYLHKQKPYQVIRQDKIIQYNFCQTFKPQGCTNNVNQAYSFQIQKMQRNVVYDQDEALNIVSKVQQFKQNSLKQRQQTNNQTNYDDIQDDAIDQEQQISEYITKCTQYSSDAYTRLFSHRYDKNDGGKLTLILKPDSQLYEQQRHTQFEIYCSYYQGFQLQASYIDDDVVRIIGNSKYGCPVFQISSLWSVVENHWIIIGTILFIIGFISLFFGRITIQITIFIAGFFICLGLFGAILTVFVGPNSGTFFIYLSFILLLVISTLISYGITRLVDISIFFVGAWFGLILAILINSIFCKFFDLYSMWSLVVFGIIFGIPFGLLTFKFRDHIIIISSSLTGAYLIVRPISWIFGGFPNQFLLYHMKQTNQLDTLPWVFFIYLILIVGLAVVGGMYQFLKLSRQNQGQQININFIQQNIQGPLDRVKEKIVDGIIDKYKSDDKQDIRYEKMKEMNQKKRVDDF